MSTVLVMLLALAGVRGGGVVFASGEAVDRF